MLKGLYSLLIILMLGACGSIKNVTIEDVRGLRMKGMSGSNILLEFQVKVNNPTGHNLYLKRSEFDVFFTGYTFASGKLNKKLKVPKHTSDYQVVNVNLQLKDLLGLSKLKHLSPDSNLDMFTISGYARGGYKLIGKKYKFNEVNLEELKNMSKK